MFKNEFQGGPSVEVFSVQGKDPLSKVKISGPLTSIKKEFDNDLKTFVLLIEGEPTRSKITIPKNSKQSLHLTQRYLVFQIYLHAGRQFSLEVSVTDQSNNKQRIILSSSNREIVVTSLHAKMPCSMVEENIWLNVCLDLNDIISEIFDGSSFAAIDSVVLSANCKLKRIFTLRSRPSGNFDIPKNIQLGDHTTNIQVLDTNTFLDAGINIRYGTGKSSKRTAHVITTDNTHIAFGSRYRNNSTSEIKNLESSASSLKTSSNTPYTGRNRKDSLTSPSSRKNMDQIVTSDSSNQFHQPMPPKQIAGKVRRPRIKSADYSKIKLNDDLKTQPLSKSADTRNRRKASDTSNDRFAYRKNSITSNRIDQSNVDEENVLPAVKLKKRLSRSEINLEHTETLINENRVNNFKSKSLNTLPKIKTNNRYKNMNNDQDMENESVFDDSSNDRTNSNMLGDDAMIEEYLRRRTNSSCHDESSLSITSSYANSTSSDLFFYSSRPRSVTGQRSNRSNEIEMEKIIETSSVDKTIFKNEIITETSQPSSSGVSSFSKHSVLVENDPNEIVNNFLKGTSNGNDHLDNNNNNNNNINNNDDDKISPVPLNSLTTGTESPSKNLEIHITKFNNDNSAVQANAGLTENNMKNFNHLHSYQMRDSCDSDTMSWLHASEDHSSSEKHDHLKPSAKLTLRRQIEERLGSLIVQSKDADTDDGFSDCSDDTTYVEPPKKFRNFRYQDEIKSIGATLDLAATIPTTPLVGEQARLSEGNVDENNNGPNVQTLKLHQSHNEELLDLLFDPVLNCYYDPVSHKYYELS